MATEFLPTLTYDDTPGIRRPSCPPCMTSRRSPTGRRQSPQPLVQRSLLSPASSPSNSPAAPPRHSQFQGTQATMALPAAVRQKSHSLSSLLLLSATGNQQQTRRATSPSNNAIALSASGTAGAGAAQYGTEAEIEEEAPSPSYRLSSTIRNGSAASLLPSTRASLSTSSTAAAAVSSSADGGHLMSSAHVSGGNSSSKWCPFFEFNDVLTTCLHRQVHRIELEIFP
jgi:hypothetical protein